MYYHILCNKDSDTHRLLQLRYIWSPKPLQNNYYSICKDLFYIMLCHVSNYLRYDFVKIS
jgi:hypothetical protein